jgi:hypothetical protein
VMIGFHYNDPNRPYVQGSLFNGKNAGGGGADNNVKSLTTRSGVAVILDDSKGSVCVKDKEGNSFSADGSGNVTIDASKQILLNCGHASITLKEDGTIAIAGKELVLLGETSLLLSSKEISSTAEKSQNISAMDVTLSGQKEVTISGTAKTTLDSMGTTTVSGTIVKLN